MPDMLSVRESRRFKSGKKLGSHSVLVGLELGADTTDSRTGHTGKDLELAGAAC